MSQTLIDLVFQFFNHRYYVDRLVSGLQRQHDNGRYRETGQTHLTFHDSVRFVLDYLAEHYGEAGMDAVIKANALERNPKLVNYEAVQKWDGKMPQYMLGNSVPFIDLK